MAPRRPNIVDLEWDENNVQHVEDHIDPWLIEEMLEGGRWLPFRNYKGHPPEHILFIGQTPNGLSVSAVLRKPTWENPGVWRPITAWLSTKTEQDRFREAWQRTRKHRG